jgi:diguanylate cyclase (GGDEF)-like protein
MNQAQTIGGAKCMRVGDAQAFASGGVLSSGVAGIIALLLAVLACLAPAAAVAEPMVGRIVSSDVEAQAFDPAARHALTTLSQRVSTVELRPASGRWPDSPRILQIRTPGLQWYTLAVPGSEPVRTRLIGRAPDAAFGHGDVAFRIDRFPVDGGPISLTIDARDVTPVRVSMALRVPDDYTRADARWLAYVSAMLAIMLAMAVMALVFASYLRDITFVWYAGYLVAYLGVLGLQTGYLHQPLGLHFETAGAPVLGRVCLLGSVLFAGLFLDRFANLSLHAPRVRLVLFALGTLIVVANVLVVIPADSASDLGRAMINPLIACGGIALLIAGLLAGVGGSRYGWIFVLGWTPLLLATTFGSAQAFGLFTQVGWTIDVGVGAGAFEALVLSVGLAYRSVELRRDRDRARRLADTDALTGLYNRRAWLVQAQGLRASARGRVVSLMFIDVDHFKALNDRHGHDAGDAVLRGIVSRLIAGLRGEDLLGRYGGEELVVALPDCDLARATDTAERLRAAVLHQPPSDGMDSGPPPWATISIGVVAWRPDESIDTALARADAAMYAAKAAGRNCVRAAS